MTTNSPTEGEKKMSKGMIYVCMENENDGRVDTVVLRTYPRETDILIGQIECEVIPVGTTIYNPIMTAYKPFIKK